MDVRHVSGRAHGLDRGSDFVGTHGVACQHCAVNAIDPGEVPVLYCFSSFGADLRRIDHSLDTAAQGTTFRIRIPEDRVRAAYNGSPS